MGSFVFRWDHPASEVYVTGTFDGWSKSERLEKTDSSFAKNVSLPDTTEKIYYKFVVDGNWVTDHTAPQENDASGNLNNVLTTDRITKHVLESTGIMSEATPSTPTSTMAAFAAALQPGKAMESGSIDLPGSFPETPAAMEKSEFSVSPLLVAEGAVNPVKLAPAEKVHDPGTFTTNTVTSAVHHESESFAADQANEDQTFRVNPLPAFAGGLNPITLAPGERLPETSEVTRNTLNSTVTTDKEFYENSGGLGNAPVLPAVVTPPEERDANGIGVLDFSLLTQSLTPNSDLPVGPVGEEPIDPYPTIHSVGPLSTTIVLAGSVPLEASKVPSTSETTQAAANESLASAVENEFRSKAPVTSSNIEERTSEGTDLLLETAKDTPAISKESASQAGQSLEKKSVSHINSENLTDEPVKSVESRDVSPGTFPGSHTQAASVVSTDIASASNSSTPAKPATETTSVPESPASSSVADKKKKRLSIFGKLKAKLVHHKE